MRVISLLPAATEIVAALGGLPALVGVSHECDFPEAVRRLPRVTSTPIDPDSTGDTIDSAVRALVAAGRPVITVDAEQLRALAPTHLITQELCDVCAVADGQTCELALALDPAPQVISLSGKTLAGVWQDIETVAGALGREAEGQRLVAELSGRLAELSARSAVAVRGSIQRFLCIEWLAPPFTAGHWVPEMVRAAGGIDIGARPGDHSLQRNWAELRSMGPDLIVIMLCGMDVARAEQELARLDDLDALALLSSVPVWIIDGNSYTSRPGPRLVNGAERLAAAISGRPMSGLVRWSVV